MENTANVKRISRKMERLKEGLSKENDVRLAYVFDSAKASSSDGEIRQKRHVSEEGFGLKRWG